MKTFRLLLLDANVVIELKRHGIWDRVTDLCDVHLARTIVSTEAHFYEDDDGDAQHFDLNEDAEAGRVTVFDIEASKLDAFFAQFDRAYLAKLDPGESESLAFLLSSEDPCLICSADAIVYRVLGNIEKRDLGVSLEEVLRRIGLSRSLAWQFSKGFREKWMKNGFDECLRGIGRTR
jgi:hypothetical protein